MQTIIPDIDENFSLPTHATQAMPELSPHEELNMRARTLKLLSDLGGDPIIPTEEDAEVAIDLARQMINDPKMRPDFTKYPNEVMAYLAGMVAQTNCMIVEELSDLKLYVVNKLVHEIEHAKDSKARLTAIKSLGEVDGVDAFKKRSEMTVKIMPIEEVEKELLKTLEDIEYHVVEESNASPIALAGIRESCV